METTEKKELEYIPDPVAKNCPKCDTVMHWCHEKRQSGRTQEGSVYNGCFAQGRHHPAMNCFLCLFCGETIPD